MTTYKHTDYKELEEHKTATKVGRCGRVRA
jgi:hypothetical protein